MSLTGDEIQAERAADKVTATRHLPKLRARRQELEREAGALAVSKQRRLVVQIATGAGAGVFGAYALWSTASGETSVFAWVAAAALGAVAGPLAILSKRGEGSRTHELDELHKQMLAVGRRIDGAERKLRD